MRSYVRDNIWVVPKFPRWSLYNVRAADAVKKTLTASAQTSFVCTVSMLHRRAVGCGGRDAVLYVEWRGHAAPPSDSVTRQCPGRSPTNLLALCRRAVGCGLQGAVRQVWCGGHAASPGRRGRSRQRPRRLGRIQGTGKRGPPVNISRVMAVNVNNCPLMARCFDQATTHGKTPRRGATGGCMHRNTAAHRVVKPSGCVRV